MLKHLLPEDKDIHREIVQFTIDRSLPTFTEGESMVEWWGQVFEKAEKYPSLGAMVRCCLSIFHGPRVESSFSLMNEIIDERSGNMNIATFNAIQTVKYSLQARETTALKLFRREDVKYGEVDRTLCRNINSAAARYKCQLAANQKAKQLQQSQLCSEPQASGSAQQAKRQTADEEKRARLRHLAKQRRKAMDTLVQAKKKKD